MIDKDLLNEVLKLPATDRLDLAYTLWDSLLNDPADVVLSNELEQELDRRYEQYLKDPAGGCTWEQAEAFIRARLRS